VLTGKTPAERQWWIDKLNATAKVMDTPKEVCKQRVLNDPRRPEMLRTKHLEVIDAFRF
jgi:hypothetical protein